MFEGPTNIRVRRISLNEDWSPSETDFLSKCNILSSVIYAADFTHRSKMTPQCTCWRIAEICTLFDRPAFNILVCHICKQDETIIKDIVRRKERIYFDRFCKPIGKTIVGHDDFIASQPSVNSSSC